MMPRTTDDWEGEPHSMEDGAPWWTVPALVVAMPLVLLVMVAAELTYAVRKLWR